MVGGADLYEGRSSSGNKEGCQDLAKVLQLPNTLSQ